MLLAVDDQVIVVFVENQRHRLYYVMVAVSPVNLLPVFVQIEIAEDDLLVPLNGILYETDCVVYGFVPVLAGVKLYEVTLEDACSVAAAQGSDLVHQLAGLLFGYEAGRLHGVDQDLELWDAEAAVADEVAFFVADQLFHDLIALIVQKLDVPVQRPNAAGYVHGLQPGRQLRLGHRMVFVRLLTQNLHDLQELDFLIVFLRHGWPL